MEDKDTQVPEFNNQNKKRDAAFSKIFGAQMMLNELKMDPTYKTIETITSNSYTNKQGISQGFTEPLQKMIFNDGKIYFSKRNPNDDRGKNRFTHGESISIMQAILHNLIVEPMQWMYPVIDKNNNVLKKAFIGAKHHVYINTKSKDEQGVLIHILSRKSKMATNDTIDRNNQQAQNSLASALGMLAVIGGDFWGLFNNMLYSSDKETVITFDDDILSFNKLFYTKYINFECLSFLMRECRDKEYCNVNDIEQFRAKAKNYDISDKEYEKIIKDIGNSTKGNDLFMRFMANYTATADLCEYLIKRLESKDGIYNIETTLDILNDKIHEINSNRQKSKQAINNMTTDEQEICVIANIISQIVGSDKISEVEKKLVENAQDITGKYLNAIGKSIINISENDRVTIDSLITQFSPFKQEVIELINKYSENKLTKNIIKEYFDGMMQHYASNIPDVKINGIIAHLKRASKVTDSLSNKSLKDRANNNVYDKFYNIVKIFHEKQGLNIHLHIEQQKIQQPQIEQKLKIQQDDDQNNHQLLNTYIQQDQEQWQNQEEQQSNNNDLISCVNQQNININNNKSADNQNYESGEFQKSFESNSDNEDEREFIFI